MERRLAIPRVVVGVFGGSANNGTNAGLSYTNANNSPSNANANYGSRQCLTQRNSDLASWQKIDNSPKVLVGTQPKAPTNEAKK